MSQEELLESELIEKLEGEFRRLSKAVAENGYSVIAEEIKEMLGKHGQSSDEVLQLLRIEAFLRDGKQQEAITCAEEMIEDPDTELLGRTSLALIYSGSGNTDKAMDELDRAEERLGSGREILRVRSDVMKYSGMDEEALLYFRKAVELDEKTIPGSDIWLSDLFGFWACSAELGDPVLFQQLQKRIQDYLDLPDFPDSQKAVISEYIANVADFARLRGWPRTGLFEFLDHLEKLGWEECERGGAYHGMFAALEAIDAKEDPKAEHTLLGCAVTCAQKEFGSSLSKDELKQPVILEGCAASLLEKHPEKEDYFAEHYPHLYELSKEEFARLKRDAEHCYDQAVSKLVSEDGYTIRSAREHLEELTAYNNSLISNLKIPPFYFEHGFPEEFEDEIEECTFYLWDDNMEALEESTASLLKEYRDETGIVRYMQVIALSRLKKGREAMKLAELLKQEFPERDIAETAMGYALKAQNNFRKAEKAFKRAKRGYSDPVRYVQGFAEVLRRTGKEDDVRTIIEECISDADPFYEAEGFELSVHYAMRLLMLEDDLFRDDLQAYEDDLAVLKKMLYRKRPENEAEAGLYFGFDSLMADAFAKDWAADGMRNLVDFMRKNRSFASYGEVLLTASDTEAEQKAQNDPKASDILILYAYMKQGGEVFSEQEKVTGYWCAAEQIRKHPESLVYLQEHYPEVIRDAREDFLAASQNPLAVQQECEEILAKKLRASRADVHEIMMKAHNDYEKNYRKNG